MGLMNNKTVNQIWNPIREFMSWQNSKAFRDQNIAVIMKATKRYDRTSKKKYNIPHTSI